jgi:hypothetical protein
MRISMSTDPEKSFQKPSLEPIAEEELEWLELSLVD